jgi:hypothetical protein
VGKRKNEGGARQARLAAALKENLKRRKAKSRTAEAPLAPGEGMAEGDGSFESDMPPETGLKAAAKPG